MALLGSGSGSHTRLWSLKAGSEDPLPSPLTRLSAGDASSRHVGLSLGHDMASPEQVIPEQESDRAAGVEIAAYGNLASEGTRHHFCHFPRVSRPTLVPSVRCGFQEAAWGLVILVANTKM